MMTLPFATISPMVAPSRGTSRISLSTTRSSPEVINSTPWRALMVARSALDSAACSGKGSQMLMNGAVSVSP